MHLMIMAKYITIFSRMDILWSTTQVKDERWMEFERCMYKL